MKTLYIHIGTMKTGTSSLQMFLTKNQEFLNSNGCAYPIFPYDFHHSKWTNGSFLVLPYYDKQRKEDEKHGIEISKQCIEAIARNFKKYDTVILSDEYIFGRLGKKYKNRLNLLLECARENNFTIKIIVYFRKQVEFIDSRWNQFIKGNTANMSFEDFVSDVLDNKKYAWYERLKEISEIFGKENIIVRRYEDAKGGTVNDFIELIGIETPKEMDLSTDSVNTNLRLSNNMANIKRYLNEFIDPKNKTDNEFCKKVFKGATSIPSLNEYKSNMFSVEEKRKIMKFYEEDNNKISDEFIRDGKPLFNDEYKDIEKWQFNNPAMVEDLIKCTMSMFGEMLTIIDEQSKEIKRLSDKHNRLVNTLKHPFTTKLKRKKSR